MNLSVYQRLAVATAWAIASTAISTQFMSPAYAAALNYSFKVNTSWGIFDGTLSIDDTSVTGIGSESTQVTAGTFKFYRPWAYQGEGHAALDNKLGEWDLAGAGVQFLGGQLTGITASGYQLASASGSIEEIWSRELSWNFSGNLFEAKWLNITSAPDETGMNGGDSTTGTLVYEPPTQAPPQSVPESQGYMGLVLGAAGLFVVQRRKKTTALVSSEK